ncbi:MAG: FKBP-type peptidyl-prolyl cis-trans isomerase [Longimicrobiales bacterium]
MAEAKNGDTVRVHYTGKFDNGQVFDSSAGRAPIEFEVGSGQVIPGFDQAVVGMQPGQEKQVTVPADQAYGPHRTEKLVEVPREEFPSDISATVGQKLLMSQGGQDFEVTVTGVSDDGVVLDANHPLAGKDLRFDLELVEIV